jgi:hypothetical protein
MNTSMSDLQAILNAAEAVARIYGDTETAFRLAQLAAEVQDAGADDHSNRPLPICPICGGKVDVAPRGRCQGCGFVFSR